MHQQLAIVLLKLLDENVLIYRQPLKIRTRYELVFVCYYKIRIRYANYCYYAYLTLYSSMQVRWGHMRGHMQVQGVIYFVLVMCIVSLCRHGVYKTPSSLYMCVFEGVEHQQKWTKCQPLKCPDRMCTSFFPP